MFLFESMPVSPLGFDNEIHYTYSYLENVLENNEYDHKTIIFLRFQYVNFVVKTAGL
jgi:hypothetical protein